MLLADRYRVLDRLGSGGMGAVMLGEDEVLKRRVALKRLHPGGGEELVGALQREARLGASLDHPGIVRVFDVLAGEDGVWIVMEHVDGGSLADLLREGPLPPGRALRVVREVAEALQHAHLKGVVHRDVKPANVLLTSGGQAKLADLGLARALDSTGGSTGDRGIGSLHYLAPEQLEGGRVEASADTYALAIVAFEALSGRRARTGATAPELLAQAAMAKPPDLHDAWPDAPSGLADALQRGMARDPADRPFTPVALADELEAALRPARDVAAPPAPPVEQRPAPDPTPHPRAPRPTPQPPVARGGGRGRALLVALLLLVIGAGVLVAALQAGDDPAGQASTTDEALPREQTVQGDEPEATTPSDAAPTTTTQDAPADAEDAPATAVRELYEAAARQDDAAVCARVSERFRAQFSCPGAFTTQFSTLREVTFGRLTTTATDGDVATVALASTARHTDRTDRCEGQVSMVLVEGGWLVDQLGVQCASS